MPTANDAIVHVLVTARNMGRRFCEDLKPDEMLHRPSPKANCAAWLLGHLTQTNRHIAQKYFNADLPPLPEGFDKKYSREEGAPQCTDFGDTSNLLPLYEQSFDALIAGVQKASPEALDKPLDRAFPLAKNVGEFASFAGLHAIMHVGQITIIRRSLGRPPLI
jgi:hypothetical protein